MSLETGKFSTGLVPRKGYFNAKVRSENNILRDYCRYLILTILKHGNIYAKLHYNICLNLNNEGVSLLNKNFASVLTTLDLEN